MMTFGFSLLIINNHQNIQMRKAWNISLREKEGVCLFSGGGSRKTLRHEDVAEIHHAAGQQL